MVIKILTAGHVVPDDNTILSFKRAVHRFIRDNKDNGESVSHGHFYHFQTFYLFKHIEFSSRQADRSPLHPWTEPHWLPDLPVFDRHGWDGPGGGSTVVQLITGPRYRETELPGGPLSWSKEEVMQKRSNF
ncbi:hypothetical protein XENOCAPTIV_017647 [Xenoophorus captivus]|uniref:Uncharacterized protein n=1 Tax=Xenoophorus captivus TaxID=1517983 RepID=A0ABV0RT42_9TELE